MLFAIFILGGGLAMSAALFPAAVRQNQTSFGDTIGTLICKNGLALAASSLGESDMASTSFTLLADEYNTGKIALSNQHYPFGRLDAQVPDGGKIRGFVLLGRRISGTPASPNEGYQLVAVAYARDKSTSASPHTVILRRIRVRWTSGTPCTFYPLSTADKDYMKIKSPVIIDQGAGNAPVQYAMIVSVAKVGGKDTATLDRNLVVVPPNANPYVYVVADVRKYPPAEPADVLPVSPALAVMSMATWVRPKGL